MRNWSLLTAVLVSLAIVGCEGRDTPITPTPDGGTPVVKYALGGSVTGLATGTRVILKTAANDVATVTANGAFAFANKLTAGTAYVVTVQTQPTGPSQTCTVTNGTGTMGTADVTNVQVACATNSFTVGGSVTGLTGTGLKLKNNNADEISVASGATSFVFPTKVASGGAFAVTISAQPAGQTCTLNGPSGTVGAGNVSSVTVNCAALTYTVGGNINGLAGTVSLTLTAGSVNETKPFNATGTFAFSTGLPTGRGYTVTVATQPDTQECTVTSGTGTIGSANVTSVTVTCAAVNFTVGGNVAGLGSGESVVLALNSTEQEATVVANGGYSFTNPVPKGSAFAVTVKTAPAGKTCSVANGTGTVSANVTNANVTCSAQTYTVGGSVTGLGTGKSVTLSNGGESVTVNQADASQTFTFAAAADGSAYDVQVATQPAGQNCTVTNGQGTLAGANVTNVAVACVDVLAVPNVMVLRVGDGTGAPTSGTSVAVSLQEYAAVAGSNAVRTINVPATDVSLTYTSGLEGALTRSTDGKQVVFGAYHKPAGTASVTATATAAVRAAVGIDNAGAATYVDFPGAFTNSNIRGAAKGDAGYWVSGNSNVTGSFLGGVWFNTASNATPVQITSTPNNARWVDIYAGQLYLSSGSGSNIGVNAVGTGTPTTGSQTATKLANTDFLNSPHGFAFIDADGAGGVDTLYVAYDNNPTVADTLAVAKFTFNTGTSTWDRVTAFAPAITGGASGARGLAVTKAGDGTTIVFAITGTNTGTSAAGPNDNKLVFFSDNGTNATPAVNVITTAASGYNLRGVALAPVP